MDRVTTVVGRTYFKLRWRKNHRPPLPCLMGWPPTPTLGATEASRPLSHSGELRLWRESPSRPPLDDWKRGRWRGVGSDSFSQIMLSRPTKRTTNFPSVWICSLNDQPERRLNDLRFVDTILSKSCSRPKVPLRSVSSRGSSRGSSSRGSSNNNSLSVAACLLHKTRSSSSSSIICGLWADGASVVRRPMSRSNDAAHVIIPTTKIFGDELLR